MDRNQCFGAFCKKYNYEHISLEELVKQVEKYLGKNVYITSHSRHYKGVLSYVFSEREQLWLEEASIVKSDIPIYSILSLFFSDVKEIAIKDVVPIIRQRIFKNEYCIQESQPHITKALIPYCDDQEPTSLFDIEPYTEYDNDNLNDDLFAVPQLPLPYKKMGRPTTYTIVETIEDFELALNNIYEERTIGISPQDGFKGRKSPLIWLAVATSKDVYLIDFLKLEVGAAMEAGLQGLLMDKAFCKVLLKSVFLEDYFFHKHQFKLENVSPPEILDLFLSTNEEKEIPSIYRNFLQLLKINLDIEKKHIPHLYSDVALRLDWNTRPLPRPLAQHLFESVFLLRELNQALIDDLFIPLTRLSFLHLESLRSKDNYSAERHDECIVPVAIQDMKRELLYYYPQKTPNIVPPRKHSKNTKFRR